LYLYVEKQANGSTCTSITFSAFIFFLHLLVEKQANCLSIILSVIKDSVRLSDGNR